MRAYNFPHYLPIATFKKWSTLLFVIFLLLSSLDGIAQNKKKKKPAKQSTAAINAYQDLTARYNRYFNAKLKFQEGLVQLSNQRDENYDEVLPVFIYDSGTGTSISSNLDQVIKKTSAAVQLKPNSKWVDDCYLLLGQAYFLKGETDEAIQSFQYISNRFSRHIRKSYDRKSAEQQKKLRDKQKEDLKKEREKERKDAEKQREAERKQYEKEREAAKKDKAKARKEADKERDAAKKQRDKERAAERKEQEQDKKEREKEKAKEKKERDKERAQDKKESLKEREKAKKEREKEKARITKLKAKEKKRRLAAKKKGKKYVPSAEYRAYLEAKKEAKEAREIEQEEKELEKELEEKTPEIVEEEEKEEEAPKEEEKKEKTPKKEKTKKEKKQKKGKDKEKKEEAEPEATDEEEEESAEEKEEETDEKISIVEEQEGEKEKVFKTGGLFGFLRHKPVKHDAMLWLLHTFIDTERYSEAASIIDYANNDETMPRRLGGLMKGLEAHYYLAREDQDKGKVALENAIKLTRKKKDKARLYYILGQLQQQQGGYAEAEKAFNKVLKSKPNYNMEFNARLNIARTRLASGEYSAPRALKYLEKMLKDDKNLDVQDQILIVMSEIALESGDEELAAKYLNDAASTASLNPAQRAKSFKRLAELNYRKGNYVLASAYYDSVMTVLPKTAENFDEMKRKKEIMSELAAHISSVELQDSLQRIANMPAGKQEQFINDLIAQYEKEAEEERLAKEQEFLKDEDNKNNKKPTGNWYFYNDAAKGLGAGEFRSKWGNRQLSDNWRLSNKATGPATGNNPVVAIGSGEDLAKVAAEGRLTKEMILQQLPTSGAAKKLSDKQIIDGLYGAGKVFREGLNNEEKATEYFQELLRRFPDNKHEAATYYNLYLIAAQNENKGDQQKYKNLILSKYPESEFAKFLEDDAYAEKAAGKQSELDKYYGEAYKLYEEEKFDESMKMINEAPTKFPKNTYQPKFDLLRALVIGSTKEKADFITALEQVIVSHPKHEVTRKAEEILLYISSGTKNNKNKPKGTANYKPTADKRHYFIVTFTGKATNIKQLTYGFSDFNKQNFSVDKLKSNNMMLDPENQIVMVKDFANAKAAMNYYRTVQQKEVEIFKGLDVPYQYFVISKNNFSEYFKRKDANEYQEFFIKNYQ